MPEEARYVMDAENVAEMGRLMRQAELTTRTIGVLPTSLDISSETRILDIACGPGEWSLAAAAKFDCAITGVDISHLMTTYAQDVARDRGFARVTFQVMDVRERLDFPDSSFDLVHMRFANAFLSTTLWPHILQECWRVLRPEGIMVSVEAEGLGVTNSPSLARYNELMIAAMRRLNQCFSEQHDYIGITATQTHLLKDAGFHILGEQTVGSNYSAGTVAHPSMYDDCVTLLKLLQPLLLNFQLSTQEELTMLYERTLEEMREPTFRARAYYQRVWGQKPA